MSEADYKVIDTYTINYTVDELSNGNLNVYRVNRSGVKVQCYTNISKKGFAEVITYNICE